MSYPVTLTVDYPDKLSRGWVLLKFFFGWLYVGIPHLPEPALVDVDGVALSVPDEPGEPAPYYLCIARRRSHSDPSRFYLLPKNHLARHHHSGI